jgi:hypothetical protein
MCPSVAAAVACFVDGVRCAQDRCMSLQFSRYCSRVGLGARRGPCPVFHLGCATRDIRFRSGSSCEHFSFLASGGNAGTVI